MKGSAHACINRAVLLDRPIDGLRRIERVDAVDERPCLGVDEFAVVRGHANRRSSARLEIWQGEAKMAKFEDRSGLLSGTWAPEAQNIAICSPPLRIS